MQKLFTGGKGVSTRETKTKNYFTKMLLVSSLLNHDKKNSLQN